MSMQRPVRDLVREIKYAQVCVNRDAKQLNSLAVQLVESAVDVGYHTLRLRQTNEMLVTVAADRDEASIALTKSEFNLADLQRKLP